MLVPNVALDVLDAVLAGTLRPREPSAAARARLFGEASGPFRYAPFIQRVARLLGVDERDADAALRTLGDAHRWVEGPVPGILFARAPHKLDRGSAMFIRGKPGAKFPLHRHHGEERVLVMEGGFRETDGTELHPGDLVVRADGSSHAFSISPGDDCVTAYVIEGGIELAC